MKLAEEKEKASLLKKSAQFIGSKLFNHCFTGWNSFDRLHIDVQAEEGESQRSPIRAI